MADSATICSLSVRVTSLPLLADVGIEAAEIGQPQPLTLSVELDLDTVASVVEEIGQTVDYRRIAAAAERLAEVHIPLIETFAHRLAVECLGWPGVTRARIVIDKPRALARGLAGVDLVMRLAPAGHPAG